MIWYVISYEQGFSTWHNCFTKNVLSIDTNVNNFVTLNVTFMLRKAFFRCFRRGSIMFHKTILLTHLSPIFYFHQGNNSDTLCAALYPVAKKKLTTQSVTIKTQAKSKLYVGGTVCVYDTILRRIKWLKIQIKDEITTHLVKMTCYPREEMWMWRYTEKDRLSNNHIQWCYINTSNHRIQSSYPCVELDLCVTLSHSRPTEWVTRWTRFVTAVSVSSCSTLAQGDWERL